MRPRTLFTMVLMGLLPHAAQSQACREFSSKDSLVVRTALEARVHKLALPKVAIDVAPVVGKHCVDHLPKAFVDLLGKEGLATVYSSAESSTTKVQWQWLFKRVRCDDVVTCVVEAVVYDPGGLGGTAYVEHYNMGISSNRWSLWSFSIDMFMTFD